MVAQRVLQKEGFKVSVAVNGREAFELCQKEQFDIILMDIEMPEMDGFAACSAIRELGQKQPVIALTAHDTADGCSVYSSAGMNGCLAKPIELAAFYALLDKLLPEKRG
jgi:CheY-like chemotaxis protein